MKPDAKRPEPDTGRPTSSYEREKTGARDIKGGRDDPSPPRASLRPTSGESLTPPVAGMSLKPAAVAKPTGKSINSGKSTNSGKSRANLTMELQKNRDEVERKKKEVKDEWHTMTQEKKLKWWSEVLELLKGEIDIEEYWFPIDTLGRKFEQRWKESKAAQRRKFTGWRKNVGTHHTKDDAVIFALDQCMQAYKEGHVVYFFKFTVQDDPTDYEVFIANGREFKVGVKGDEHIAQSTSDNRVPFVCMKQGGNSKWGGRRFGRYGELKKCGEEYDPTTHKIDHDLGIFGLFLGDDGAYKHEFDMTLVGRLFFLDFQCMNRSYCGISRDSCVDQRKPALHGCGSITFHVKDGLVKGVLATNKRYAKYDGAKSGGSHLPYRHDPVNVLPTAKEIRKAKKRHGNLDDESFDHALSEAPSFAEYRWNLMADRLQLYAMRNGWKKGPRGNMGIHNIVKKENCNEEDYSDREISDLSKGEPYLYQWWKIMLHLLLMNTGGRHYDLTDEQKARLEKIGVSFHHEDIKAIDDILKGKGQQKIKAQLGKKLGKGRAKNKAAHGLRKS
mmetsp:Transcript_28824/g.43553  ORF Transcript_28824/g.43553 Transcript_28824/m.43553 type:complete len:557 (+) Transcript_28824:42-1712(+)|eukprot:scaffold1528_cov83-Skeletonema_dohrnii-CCMP3373.AAC.3